MKTAFGKKLRKWRRAAGLIQKDAAERLAVNVRTYQGWEEGKTTPNPLSLAELDRRMGNS